MGALLLLHEQLKFLNLCWQFLHDRYIMNDPFTFSIIISLLLIISSPTCFTSPFLAVFSRLCNNIRKGEKKGRPRRLPSVHAISSKRKRTEVHKAGRKIHTLRKTISPNDIKCSRKILHMHFPFSSQTLSRYSPSCETKIAFTHGGTSSSFRLNFSPPAGIQKRG